MKTKSSQILGRKTSDWLTDTRGKIVLLNINIFRVHTFNFMPSGSVRKSLLSLEKFGSKLL